jgi:pimeloyl-ACP methyl ester carboxylesterase
LSGELNTAIVGHSIGAYLSAIVAALAADPAAAIPSPRAVVGVEPGGMDLLPFEDFGMISPATKMVLIVGDEDKVACKSTAVAIWENTPQIADVNRDLLLVRSDRHGAPAQVANHTFPNTTGTNDTAAVDARDFFVTFKLSVAALNCAFGAKDCSYAVGNGTTEQTDMGIWSDGVPLVPLLSVDDPLQMQTTCQDP